MQPEQKDAALLWDIKQAAEHIPELLKQIDPLIPALPE